MEEVGVDEVVETTKEDEHHSATERSGTDDGRDPVYTSRRSGPSERKEADWEQNTANDGRRETLFCR